MKNKPVVIVDVKEYLDLVNQNTKSLLITELKNTLNDCKSLLEINVPNLNPPQMIDYNKMKNDLLNKIEKVLK